MWCARVETSWFDPFVSPSFVRCYSLLVGRLNILGFGQVSIMVGDDECYQVDSPFLSFLLCLEKQSIGIIGCASTDAPRDNV